MIKYLPFLYLIVYLFLACENPSAPEPPEKKTGQRPEGDTAINQEEGKEGSQGALEGEDDEKEVGETKGSQKECYEYTDPAATKWEWSSQSKGELAPKAISANASTNAVVCRAKHEGGIYPGNLKKSDGCYIIVDSQIIKKDDYEVLAIPDGDNTVFGYVQPSTSIAESIFPVGRSSESCELNVCLVTEGGTPKVGQLQKGKFNRCHVASDDFSKSEILESGYKVLVLATAE